MSTAKANFFFPIIDTWPEYFENPHEGLGTTYERFLLHQFFEKIQNRFNVQSVLEAPAFGMTGVSGINSLWWAAHGIQPTIVDDNSQRLQKIQKVWQSVRLKATFCQVNDFSVLPFKDQSFDLAYNFAALWFVNSLNDFLKELSRVTKRVLFISVPNRLGIGYQIRLHWPGSKPPALNFAAVKPKNFVQPLADLGWQLVEKGYFDIPPWPDFPLKKEVLLNRFKLGSLLKKNENASGGERMTILDFFTGKRPDLQKEVFKFNFLEKAPFPIRQLWAHHRYFIFVKE